MIDQINFYESNKPYGEFSNFARFPVEVDGQVWPTSEHYYQAQKFMTPELQERIRQVGGPGMSKRMGGDRSLGTIRSDWDQVKDDIMRKVVRAKFKQHEELRTLLLSTGDAVIAEHTKNDKYWGDGGNGKGKNMLGVILMEVREELRV